MDLNAKENQALYLKYSGGRRMVSIHRNLQRESAPGVLS
jgi:hypothetical protein